MKYKEDIILILDSILDDYYYLWECYYDYCKYRRSKEDLLQSFSEALKEAYENKFFNFFEGKNFDGDEVLITNFYLNDLTIQELLKWDNESKIEIRIATSIMGIKFLDINR
ncbi:hypothetical protein [Chryseobacterium takakiae]|uniref:Uncharacterized protein n=1 Tax=Chryseobacterium takakiae TaxID=1302685 RepID=A0A1M4UHB4_9FLAO|nr:hypothetical protein [Chryseobacterium takakiae]SHE56065.1 hypothetical protein SAMN05444408_102106 [Chryseobacterium takakiae]